MAGATASSPGPRVGISPCLDAAGRIRPGRRTQYLDVRYAEAIAAAGGVPFYLAAAGPVAALLGSMDALLIPGGDDFAPQAPYPADVRFDPVAPAQRAFDEALLAAVLGRGLPVLGICYGMQLLALGLGGTLVYDIGHDLPDAESHRLDEAHGRHDLIWEPGSRLHELLGDAPGAVNSLHHQAVATPGPRLQIGARSPDGVIEAIELEAPDRFVMGVQWHPEKLEGPHRDRLFRGFVDAAR